MALKKLTIQVETSVFNFSDSITALFNPEKLVFSKTVSWKKQEAKGRDVPELQFENAQPRTLKLDLIFDTYDPDPEQAQKKDKDVRKEYTDKIMHLTTVEKHGDKHRPPLCRLLWGSVGVFFQGVLESLEQQFTLFLEDGTPVRAKLSCTFKEWRTNYEDLNRQATTSSDIAKTRLVKRGDSLSSIAAEEYRDPQLWRPIARENGIDDPCSVRPGMLLMIPTLSDRSLY